MRDPSTLRETLVGIAEWALNAAEKERALYWQAAAHIERYRAMLGLTSLGLNTGPSGDEPPAPPGSGLN